MLTQKMECTPSVYPGLAFLGRICHHTDIMQKVEKWRIQELSQILDEMADLFQKAGQAEWAQVFLHFSREASALSTRDLFELSVLQKLIRNIRCCFEEARTLESFARNQGSQEEAIRMNLAYIRIKSQLLQLISKMETAWNERIH